MSLGWTDDSNSVSSVGVVVEDLTCNHIQTFHILPYLSLDLNTSSNEWLVGKSATIELSGSD